MCLYPKLIQNRKYTKTKKNGGNIPPLPIRIINGKETIDKRVTLVPVGCQKCMECMKKKAREWKVRLQEEIKSNNTAKFVTLTFSNNAIKELSEGLKLEGYELDNEIATIAMRRYLERWRKKYKTSVKHWFTTELGHNGTENIHMHGIMFTNEREDIHNIWKYGYTHVGEYVNDSSINYITKYMTKIDFQHKYFKPKILTSKGIGANYMTKIGSERNKYKNKETDERYITTQGIKLGLPIYYRNKIYTEEERTELWQNKLDEDTRYVLGQKIVNNDELYYKALEDARKINNQLGYGNNEINWEKRRYERDKRKILHEKRINAPSAREQHNK